MSPALLILDEVGYLPLDKAGADLLFQIVSQRYERGALIVTTNKAYKHWPAIFHNDVGHHSRDSRPSPAPRRDHRHRRQILPHERPPHGRTNGGTDLTRAPPEPSPLRRRHP